jgi:4-aminobutyrate aminotransferase-like enzyme
MNRLWERRNRALGKGAEYFYDTPIEIVRGEGAYLFDAAGRRYVDLYNNVPCVGHGNSAVANAMAKQQGILNVHNRYLHGGIVDFAERLVGLHHDGIESVVFSCSGTEANEVALSMARSATGKRGIVCTDAAYHGSAGLVATLTSIGSTHTPNADVCGFPYPDLYRHALLKLSNEELCQRYLEQAAAAIAHLKSSDIGFAGLIACPIFANEGLPDIPGSFMHRLTALVHREGGLMISDEVQSGYCRTGKWWGYQQENFTPDIVVMGKPMGNGLPLAATAASRPLVEHFRAATGYFNTFASTPLQAAVGMAVLDEIERMGLLNSVNGVGDPLRQALLQRANSHARLGDVRGCGLFISIEIVVDKKTRQPDSTYARQLANKLRQHGCLLSYAGALDNVVKIRPPLVFTAEHAGEFLLAFDASLAELDD